MTNFSTKKCRLHAGCETFLRLIYVNKLSKTRETKTKKQSPLFAISPLVNNTIEVIAPLNIDDSNVDALKIKNRAIEVGDPVKFA